MTSIYFAGPLFSEAEKRFNAALTARIEALGYRVFLPQRDGFEVAHAARSGLASEEIRQAIFALDTREVLAADIFLFVLDGRVPDEGACFELGLAYGQKRLQGLAKPIVGLLTDVRVAFADSPLNPMLSEALDHLFRDEDSLLAWLKELRDGAAD